MDVHAKQRLRRAFLPNIKPREFVFLFFVPVSAFFEIIRIPEPARDGTATGDAF